MNTDMKASRAKPPPRPALAVRAEVKKLTADLKRIARERDNLLAALGEGSEAAGPIAAQIAKTDAQCQKLTQRLEMVQQELAALKRPTGFVMDPWFSEAFGQM